jgi:hypothetical protein
MADPQVYIPPVLVNFLSIEEDTLLRSVQRNPDDYCSVSVPAKVNGSQIIRQGGRAALVFQVQPALVEELIKLPKIDLSNAALALDVSEVVTVNIVVARKMLTEQAAAALQAREDALNGARAEAIGALFGGINE